jgi:hypothetical protein
LREASALERGEKENKRKEKKEKRERERNAPFAICSCAFL